MSAPILSVRGLRRDFANGDEVTAVLKDIDVDIWPGEMVAIIGASGSGKSTLMNIFGCLDRATAGTYLFAGRDVSTLKPDELAALRREHFGFIFQRYQLLSDLDAVENVEVPAIYAGVDGAARRQRAEDLLRRLGLGDRLDHRPSQLSGGQQQRVSVARALMNGGEIILADEPTGALDSRSGTELMALLAELNADGHTIVIVTHDPAIAAQCGRIIEISDGIILSDRRSSAVDPRARRDEAQPRRMGAWREAIDRGLEALRMAWRSMVMHKLRTFLTMLGIIIGIASVVTVVALGQGSQESVLESISSIGTNTINVRSGSGFGDRTAGRIRTLVPLDAEILAAQPFADAVTPQVSANRTVLYRNLASNGSISGVGADYFRVSGTAIVSGVAFGADGVEARAQEAVIDQNTVDELFGDGRNPIGEVLMIENVPVRVVGIAEARASMGFGGNSMTIYMPYTTVMNRILGQQHLAQISIRVADGYDMALAEQQITATLDRLHGTRDFFLQNTDTIRETIESTSQTLTLLISMIAVISLVVGGIGVMNIMLVSVSERTREIGIRMAVGARRGDILRQFLVEAVMVCFIGGTAGVLLSFVLGGGIGQLMEGARLSYSGATIATAFLSSTLIGVVFGFMPARSAARLNPLEALTRE